MALGDTVRELLIKLGLLGQAEVKAGLESTTADIEKLGAAQTTAAAAGTSASTEQVAALKNVESALTRAQAVATAFGESAKVSADAAKLAYPALEGAVKGVEEAIRRAQQLGPIVPQASLDALNKLPKSFDEATKSLGPHKTAVDAAGKAHEDMALRVLAGRGMLERFARAIELSTQSSNGFVAAIGRLAMPLAAAIGAFLLLNKVAGELQQRGVDVTTMGDRLSATWDAIAQSMGGVSAATAAATAEFIKASGKLDELTTAERAYASALDLIAAAGPGAARGMQEYAASFAGLRDAQTAVESLNKAFNNISALAPQRAAAYREEFLGLLSAVRDGTAGSIEALDVFRTATIKAGQDADRQIQAIAKAYEMTGAQAKQFAQEMANVSATSINAAKGLETLRSASLSEAESWKVVGGQIQAVLSFYRQHREALNELEPAQRALIERLAEEAQAHDPVMQALKAHSAETRETAKSYAALIDGVDAATKKWGTYRLALENIHGDIDAQITALERQKASVEDLDIAEEARLRSLLALHAVMTPLTVEEEKQAKTHEDGAKKIHDLSKSYEDLTRARETDKKSIEDHRIKFIAGLEAEMAKAKETTAAQIKAIQEQFKQGEISNDEYFKSVNEMYANLALAHQAALDAEDKANEEAAKKEKDHQRVYEELADEMAKVADKYKMSLVDIKLAQTAFDVDSAKSLDNVRKDWDETSKKVKDHALSYAELADKLSTFERNTSGALAGVGRGFDELTKKVQGTRKEVQGLVRDAALISVGPGGTAPPTTKEGELLYAPGGET